MKRKLLLFFVLLIAVGVKAAEDLQPTEITPESGTTYLISDGDGSVVFTFDRQLKIDKAYIIPANDSPIEIGDIMDMYTNAYYYYCRIGSQMKALIKDGTITAGENFQIKLQGIKDATDVSISYNDVTATFVAGNLPAELVSINPHNDETINSFYPEGGTDGLITFTFTDPVVCESAKISYGDVEAGTYGTIDVPTKPSGSTLIADIRGIKLSPADINKQTSITLQILRVKTTDGLLLEGNTPGSPGAYVVNYNIKSSSVEVSYRFTPDKGSNIDNVEQLKCYFSYPITFDGVKLSYTLGGGETSIIIPKEQIAIENDPNDDEGAFFAYIPIKDLSFDAGNVDVEFVGGMDSNGNAVEVKGTFLSAGKHADVTTCLSVTPTPGSKLVPRPEAFVFTFSDVVTMDMSSVLVIGGVGMPLTRLASVNKNVLTVPYQNMMYGDLTFKLRLKNTAGNFVTYGDTEGYVTVSYSAPSDLFTCSGTDPIVGKVESLKVFTLTFDGVDEYDCVGGFDDSKEIVLKNEAGEKVTTGTIDLPKDYYAYPFDAIVTLADEVNTTGIYTLVVPEKTVYNSLYDDFMDDFGVSGGAVYNPELIFTYTIGDVTPTTCTNVDPAPAQNMDAIPTQFAFTFSRNVTLSGARMTSDENPRGGADISEYVAVADNVLTITLPEGMTDSYTFVNFMLQVTDITGAYVTYGDVNDYVVAGYTKKVEANTFVCSFITPGEGGVDSLKEFILTFVGVDEFDMVGGFDTTKEIVLKDEVGAIVTTGTIDFSSDWDHPLDAVINLEKEVAGNGTYTLIIPEGTVYNGLYDDMAEDFGVSFGAIYNPELTYTYIILTHGIDSVMAGELSGIVEVYSLQGVLLRKADASEALKGLIPGIYIVNGKKIAVK